MLGDGGLTSSKQVVADFNADGRPDVLRMILFQGQAHLEISTDADMTPAGRLIRVQNGSGGEENIHYATLAQARALGDDSGKNPAQGWVVDRISRRSDAITTAAGGAAGAGSQELTWTYYFMKESYGSDPNSRDQRPKWRGFGRMLECQPTHVMRMVEHDFSNGRPGILQREALYRNASGAATKCDDVSVAQSETTYYTDDVIVPTSINQQRVHRYLPSWTIRSVSAPDEFGGQLYLYSGTYYGYEPNTALANQVIELRDLGQNDDDVITQTTWDFPTGYMARTRSTRTDASLDGSFARTDLTYDAGRPALLTAKRVWSSPIESQQTTMGYDDAGLLRWVRQPSQRETRFCWDAYGLFQVAAQGPDGARSETIYDYGTGQPLESRGPVGLSTDPIVCPPRATEIG
jgi:hypothetical protein